MFEMYDVEQLTIDGVLIIGNEEEKNEDVLTSLEKDVSDLITFIEGGHNE